MTGGVWSVDLASLPTLRAAVYKVARVTFLALSGFVRDRSSVRASALTYITVLSLVPLLAFSFSVAKGLGAYDALRQDTIEPFLDKTIGLVAPEAPEPPAAGEPEAGTEPAHDEVVATTSELRVAIDRVLQFVENTNVSSLGSFGLLILVFTVIQLLGAIEQSFNDIWGIKKSRSLLRKFSDYLSMVVVVPILVILASSALAAVQDADLLDSLKTRLGTDAIIEPLLRAGSLAVMWLGFAFVYLFMPNTRTRIVSALIGGIVGGTLWQLAQVLHVRAQVGVANYNKLYAGFAAFPIFMVWLYVSWLTVLLGAQFAFAHQNEPHYRQVARTRHLDQAFRERLGLRVVARIAAAFLRGRPAPSAFELADEIAVPERAVQDVVDRLVAQRLVIQAEDAIEPSLLPARELDTITVKQVLDALKGAGGPVEVPPGGTLDRELEELYSSIEEEREASAHNKTLRELAELEAEPPGELPAIGPRRLEAGGDAGDSSDAASNRQ